MAAATLVLAAGARTFRGDGLDRVAWLAGCWRLEQGARHGLEMWMPPEGGMMLGASRTTVNGVVREYEHLRLALEGTRLVYTARPSGQAEASFRSEGVTDSSFTVANPAHDFPQRIGYRRRGPDSLVAWIEGPGKSGTLRMEYPMKRVDCREG
jgi:hypothetical protein